MRKRLLLLIAGVMVIALTGIAGYSTSSAEPNSPVELRNMVMNVLNSSGPLIVEATVYEIRGEETRLVEVIRQQLDKENKRNIVQWYDEKNVISRSIVINEDKYLSINHDLPWVYTRAGQQEAGPEQLGVVVIESILRNGQLVTESGEKANDNSISMVLPEGEGKALVEIGSNGLPARVEITGAWDLSEEAGTNGETPPDKSLIVYQYKDRGPVTSAETELEIPNDLVGREDYIVLAKEAPKAPNKTYGQYWLGDEFNGRVVVSAQSIDFAPRPDYEPIPGDMVSIVYRYPDNASDGGTSPGDILLGSHPMKGTGGEDSLKWIMERMQSEGGEKRGIEVDGQKATAYILGPVYEGGPVNGAVLLSDAIVLFDAERPDPGDVDAILTSLKKVD